MDEKKYEAGRVEISSAEYRDLVKEAVESSEIASRLRNENWKLESENKKLEEELSLAKKHVEELISKLNMYESAFRGSSSNTVYFTHMETEDNNND